MKVLWLVLVVFGGVLCSYGQDILVKHDSTRLNVKVVEINPATIKYKRFDYLDGPTYILQKQEVFVVIYKDGTKDFFKQEPVPAIISAREENKDEDARLRDYVKFNVQVGVSVQNSNSNSPKPNQERHSKTSSETFSGHSDKTFCNINIGFNGLFGSSRYVKHIIGVNYLRSVGEFDYKASNQSNQPSTSRKMAYYSSKVDFINIITGIRITIAGKFHIEPMVALNCVANTKVIATSTLNTVTYSGGPIQTVIKDETVVLVENNPVENFIGNTISFCPRLAYEFKVKNQQIGTYLSYNMAFQYRLPWLMFGVTWYPFKKLR